MFEFVRKHTKLMMILMFLLIIPAFVVTGMEGFKSIRAGGDTVATVGNHSITQGEWDAAHKAEADRLRAQMPNVDAKLLDSPERRYAALERLVRERVLTAAVEEGLLNTTDARFQRLFRESPEFEGIRKPDGTRDKEIFTRIAASQGMTADGLEARLRTQITERQVEAGLMDTAFSPALLSDVALNALYEQREAQVTRFNPADYASKVNPTDAEIEAFYQANQPLFLAPESATIEYVVLDLDAVRKSISLNEADVKTYYEQNAARLSGKEERRASHILITAAKDMPADERKKARERADALLAQVRKAPDTFADLARKNSQDPGSAPNGGDLDFFARGAMVKPFEEAAFAMQKGDISDVVESDFGFHIIKVTDIKAPKQRSFEELRPMIEADLKNQQAQRKFAEIAESFTNGVYEESDNLKGVADRLKLEVKTISNLQRKPGPGVTGVLANPKFLAAVFSADSLEKKRNTEAVEIGANQLASARITQYTAASTRPLADVRAQVKDRLVAKQAAELAVKDGVEKLAAWKTSAPESLPAAVTIARDGKPVVPPQVLDAVMQADSTKLPAWVGVDLGAQGYMVARVNKVSPRNAPAAATAEQERKQYAQLVASAENKAYYKMLSQRFKVTIKTPRPVPGALAQTLGAE